MSVEFAALIVIFIYYARAYYIHMVSKFLAKREKTRASEWHRTAPLIAVITICALLIFTAPVLAVFPPEYFEQMKASEMHSTMLLQDSNADARIEPIPLAPLPDVTIYARATDDGDNVMVISETPNGFPKFIRAKAHAYHPPVYQLIMRDATKADSKDEYQAHLRAVRHEIITHFNQNVKNFDPTKPAAQARAEKLARERPPEQGDDGRYYLNTFKSFELAKILQSARYVDDGNGNILALDEAGNPVVKFMNAARAGDSDTPIKRAHQKAERHARRFNEPTIFGNKVFTGTYLR